MVFDKLEVNAIVSVKKENKCSGYLKSSLSFGATSNGKYTVSRKLSNYAACT